MSLLKSLFNLFKYLLLISLSLLKKIAYFIYKKLKICIIFLGSIIFLNRNIDVDDLQSNKNSSILAINDTLTNHQKSTHKKTAESTLKHLHLLGLRFSLKKWITYQSYLIITFIIMLSLTITTLIYDAYYKSQTAKEMQYIGQTLMHAQRLAKATTMIFNIDNDAYLQIKESLVNAQKNITLLKAMKEQLWFDSSYLDVQLQTFQPKWQTTQYSSIAILQVQSSLEQINYNYSQIIELSPIIIDKTQQIEKILSQYHLDQQELNLSSKLSLLAGRILYKIQRLYVDVNTNQDMIYSIDSDVKEFNYIFAQLKQRYKGKSNFYIDIVMPLIEEVGESFVHTQDYLQTILNNMPFLLDVKKSQTKILKESEPIRLILDDLQRNDIHQNQLSKQLKWTIWLLLIIDVILLILILYINAQDWKLRVAQAMQRQKDAEHNRAIEEIKNKQNQQAIVRLMDELQPIASGDFSKFITVDENITGIIADTINYTLEQLRELIRQVKQMTQQVVHNFNHVKDDNETLLYTIQQQSQEINEASNRIQDVAQRIQDLSNKTQSSINIAQESNQVNEENKLAAHQVLIGIQSIRNNIQDTHKYIKRLGERSLQISDINEFTANLTQQIHILALNAAIVASRAGESGKGLNIIAQEVQKLAEKSRQSMQRVEELIHCVQDEVREATISIENSTQTVIQVTQLSDKMDIVLHQMDDTHRKLVDNIQGLVYSIEQESKIAHLLSAKVKNLSETNQQTLEKTKQNVTSTLALAGSSEDLQHSVERFKVD